MLEVLIQKEHQLVQLKQKLATLQGHNLDVSYTLDLNIYEQVRYAKIGLFWLGYDINKMSKAYGGYYDGKIRTD